MRRIIAAAFFAAIGFTAAADEISLTAPMTGAALHEGGVDMSIYYTATATGAEVVATYVAPARAFANDRLSMAMAPGEQVAFSLPGAPQTLYRFAFDEAGLTVAAEPVWARIASR